MSGDVVLGGGIAGLGAAYAYRHAGQSVPVFEAGERAGGILDSFNVDGWQFDNGVHLSFASEPEVREIFDRTPYVEHDAVSLNWDNGHWLRHPVQNNMYPLPVVDKIELIGDLVESKQFEIQNYRDWLICQYGRKIAERWPLVYTRKYWTIEAERMGTSWIGSRMRRSDLREVLRGAMSPDAPNTYYISRMRYPVKGGYRAFIAPLEEAADIRPRHRAVGIDWQARRIMFEGGRQVAYQHLISTIPLPLLVSIMTDVPPHIARLASTLFATTADLISIGFNRPAVAPSLWFYIYDTDIYAARAYSPSWKSPNNAPDGCSSLQFEIYSSVHRPLQASVEELKENCIYALQKMGLARRQDIALLHHKTLPYANVVFDLGMEERRKVVRAWVEACAIKLAGRFGEWDYLWSNQSFLSGYRTATALIDQSGISSKSLSIPSSD